MNDLEREYRKALARYPRAWRRNHEEALLGVLLDKAEAEGRRHMSKTDRKDLAINSRRLRFNRALSYVLFAVAGIALLFAATMAISGTPLDVEVLITPPAIPAPPVGGSYQPLFVISQPAWALYATGVGVLVVAALAGILLTRRNRRADRMR